MASPPLTARLCGAVLWLAAVAAAQQPAAPADKYDEDRLVRFLAVGDLPPFRQEIRNGVAYELDPPPGSVPPRRLTVATGREQTAEAILTMGTASAPVRMAKAARELRAFDGVPGDSPWLKLAMPEEPLPGLVVLWRAPAGQAGKASWDKPAALWVRDAPAQAGPRSVRVVNVSPFVVAAKFGEETMRLAPRAVWWRRHPGGAGVALAVGAATGGDQWTTLYAGAVECGPQERVLVVVYLADGEQARRPAKALVIRERTAAVSQPPKPQVPAPNGG